MATYRQIQDYVRETHGFTPKTCWIAEVKELCGLEPRPAWNRLDTAERSQPCPGDKIEPIRVALRHFGMI